MSLLPLPKLRSSCRHHLSTDLSQDEPSPQTPQSDLDVQKLPWQTCGGRSEAEHASQQEVGSGPLLLGLAGLTHACVRSLCRNGVCDVRVGGNGLARGPATWSPGRHAMRKPKWQGKPPMGTGSTEPGGRTRKMLPGHPDRVGQGKATRSPPRCAHPLPDRYQGLRSQGASHMVGSRETQPQPRKHLQAGRSEESLHLQST